MKIFIKVNHNKPNEQTYIDKHRMTVTINNKDLSKNFLQVHCKQAKYSILTY